MLMNDQKIKFPEQLNEAERLEFLNYLLQILQSNSSQSEACTSPNDERDSHAVDDKLDYNCILFSLLSEINLTSPNNNLKSVKQLQTIFDDGVARLQKIIDKYVTSPELETRLNKLFDSIETKMTKVITRDIPQLKDRVYQPPNLENRLFENSKYQILPAALPMKTSTLCQLRDDFWQQDNSNGIAYYRQESHVNSNNYIEHYISSSEDIQVLPWDSARQIIDKFGFNTVLLQLLFAAHAVKCLRPWESEFSLSGKDIIKELGWENRTDISLHSKLLELANTSFALDCLLIKAVWENPNHKKGKKRVTIDTSRMWNVRVQMTGQMDLEGNVKNPEDLHISVRPGMWTKGFMDGGKHSQDALYQFGYLAQDVIKINPYHNELALRLAIHLTLDSHADRVTEYRVRDLLEIAMPKYKIDLAGNDRKRKHKLKEQWDRAIGKLTELGWVIEFDDHSYPPEIRPDSDIKRHQHSYLEKLLDAKVYIRSTFPQKVDIDKHLHDLVPAELPPLLIESKPASKLKNFKTQTHVATPNLDLRQARENKGWTQRQLAAELQVSQSLVAQWERGNRSIDEKNMVKLQTMLGL